jgi:hypothetical protein
MNLPIFAEPFYLSDQINTQNSPNVPLRIRIQSNDDNNMDINKGADDVSWKELPSALHLSILQMLQPPQPSSSPNADSGYADAGGDAEITVGDIHSILLELNNDDGEGEGKDDYSWGKLTKAVKWLFEENLGEIYLILI